MQEFAADYESVRKVLKAGEAFCHASELSFSRDAQALCDKVNALPRCRAKLLGIA
jgi:hypothetical protein